MAIITPNTEQVVSVGSATARVNFEIPQPVEKTDGTIDQEALAKALVTHYRNTYKVLSDGSITELQFQSGNGYPIPLAEFLIAVGTRLNMQPAQTLAVFKAIIEELDGIYQKAITSPPPATQIPPA
jgi:hypothetical protein